MKRVGELAIKCVVLVVLFVAVAAIVAFYSVVALGVIYALRHMMVGGP